MHWLRSVYNESDQVAGHWQMAKARLMLGHERMASIIITACTRLEKQHNERTIASFLRRLSENS